MKPTDPPMPRDTVVLLHGLGRGPWSMKRIEWALGHDGYRTLNIGYPSRQHDIATLAGTSRETASRVISRLTHEGVLTPKGRLINVDLARLAEQLSHD